MHDKPHYSVQFCSVPTVLTLFMNFTLYSVQSSSSVMSDSLQPHELHHARLLSSTVSWSLLKFMFIELVMLSNHLILCHHLLFLPSIFPSIRVWESISSLQRVSSSHQMAKVLELQLQQQSFQ